MIRKGSIKLIFFTVKFSAFRESTTIQVRSFMNYIIPVTCLMMLLNGCAYNQVKIDSLDGLKIALLADTQYTTDKLTENYGFRSQLADRFENVSIRPAAVEALALENMENMGKDLGVVNPDIVLYLGDGANSGCKDEVDKFFESLRHVRTDIGLPVFFVPGNHDYLGTGNQDKKQVRRKLCGGHDFYSKGELIELTSSFNRSSFNDFNHSGLLTEFSENSEGRLINCRADIGESEHLSGCFYSAYIEFRKSVDGDLLLVDTSDYRDIDARPALGSYLEGYGLRGAISYNELKGQSQIGWFENIIGDSGKKPKIRMIASHYPSNDLKWDVGPLDFAGRTGSLLLENNQNIWFSGHTHTDKPESAVFLSGKFSGGELMGERRYAEVNVGSTTDHPPHTSTISNMDGTLLKEDRFLPGYKNSEACNSVYEAIESFSTDNPAYGSNGGYIGLGMTTDYKSFKWNGVESLNARENLSAFLAQYSTGPSPNHDRNIAVSCIVGKASFFEYTEN